MGLSLEYWQRVAGFLMPLFSGQPGAIKDVGGPVATTGDKLGERTLETGWKGVWSWPAEETKSWSRVNWAQTTLLPPALGTLSP